MKVITQRDRILTVADRWRRQYSYKGVDQDKLDILKNLEALDLATCSAEDVDRVIGNNSWTCVDCNECEAKTDWVIVVGEEPDYESQTARLCRSCVQRAFSHISTPAYWEAPKTPHLCPKCDGEGHVRILSEAASGANQTRPCPVCNGEKVIWG